MPLEPVDLLQDEDLQLLTAMDLQQAIQSCIDLALHACVDNALGLPDGPADAFSRLARSGVFPDSLAVRLTGAAALRNLLVHRYGEIDHARLLGVIESDLGDLVDFVHAMRSATTRE